MLKNDLEFITLNITSNNFYQCWVQNLKGKTENKNGIINTNQKIIFFIETHVQSKQFLKAQSMN